MDILTESLMTLEIGVVRHLESKCVPNGVSATRNAIRNAGHV